MATIPMRHLVAVFTPSATDPETLAAFTVGRNTERDVLARAIDDAATSTARAHVLLVGSRGAGKSHLLALAAHHARTQHPGDRVKVALLPEDVYAVASYRDLLAELLAAASGTRPDPGATADALEASLVNLARPGVVVAVVENLHRIMAIIGREGQHALRAFLHNQPALLLLASTPSLFEGVTSHAEPFYGAFRVLHLGELSAEDGRELLLHIARLDGDDALGAFLSSDTGLMRLRAVAHLAGGLPRLWLLLARCITVELLDELVPLFVKLLDELTPYYKARMDELSPTKARVVSALCFARSRGAMTVRDIAAVTGTSQQTCSKLLHDLERERFVVGRKIPGTDQRVTYYEVREPLLRHCLELKVSHGRPLALIVDVLRHWYDATALRQVGHARDLFDTLVIDRTRVLGPDHQDTLAARYNHAYCTGQAGGPAHARDLLGTLLTDQTRAFGPDNPRTRATRAAIRALASGDETIAALARSIRTSLDLELVGQLAFDAGATLCVTVSAGASGHDELRSRLRPLLAYPSAAAVVLLAASIDRERFEVAPFVGACRAVGVAPAIAGAMRLLRDVLPGSYVRALADVAAALNPQSGHEALVRGILEAAVRASNGDGAALAELPPESRALAKELAEPTAGLPT